MAPVEKFFKFWTPTGPKLDPMAQGLLNNWLEIVSERLIKSKFLKKDGSVGGNKMICSVVFAGGEKFDFHLYTKHSTATHWSHWRFRQGKMVRTYVNKVPDTFFDRRLQDEYAPESIPQRIWVHAGVPEDDFVVPQGKTILLEFPDTDQMTRLTIGSLPYFIDYMKRYAGRG